MRKRILPGALLALLAGLCLWWLWPSKVKEAPVGKRSAPKADTPAWSGPDSTQIPKGPAGDEIRYGMDLVERTALYYGPYGSLDHASNGMNCQNCHLAAGTKAWGNNFGAVQSTYPRYRPRRGAVETLAQRINDCFQRSMNGRPLDSTGREMQAILAYIRWVGRAVPKGQKPKGSALTKLPGLARAADPRRGAVVFVQQCQRCHGPRGEGKFFTGTFFYQYPPLWGPHSYNTASGMYRIGSLAAFAQENMPFGVDHGHRVLTVEEAWDVAAFINSQPRPRKNFAGDYPRIFEKPEDYPFGPFADSFSEKQHKYGPFGPILAARSPRK